MAKYTVHQGEFKCYVCGAKVSTLRHNVTEKTLSWSCAEKHISQVSLKTKKTKANFE